MTEVLRTERLIVRAWEDKDIPAMAAISQDKVVMEHFPSTRTLDQTVAFVAGNKQLFADKGYCLYAIELLDTSEMIGFAGLNYTDFPAKFTPNVEIAWRIGKEYWGKGYAFEAASAVRDYAFDVLELGELVSFTVPANKRSIKLMEKLGFERDLNGDFAHPNIDKASPLSRHVLYRLDNSHA